MNNTNLMLSMKPVLPHGEERRVQPCQQLTRCIGPLELGSIRREFSPLLSFHDIVTINSARLLIKGQFLNLIGKAPSYRLHLFM